MKKEIKEIEKIECYNCDKEIKKDDIYIGEDEENYCEDCFNELFFTCSSCNKNFSIDESQEGIDGKLYCKDCFSENFSYCEDCGKDVWKEGAQYLELYEKIVCDDCIDRHYETCSDCNKIIYHDDAFEVHNGCYICENCRENYGTCDDCGYIFELDDLNYSESNNSYYCQDCYVESSEYIKPYSYKPSPIFHKTEIDKNNSKLYFGIELEIESKNIEEDAEEIYRFSDDEYLFYLKEDGSLKNGFEIVSHPCTLQYHKENFQWEKIISKLKSLNCLSFNTNSCGIHIHFSKRVLSEIEKIKIGIFYNIYQDFIEKIAQRKSNSFSKIKSKKLTHYALNDERYEAVNFCNNNTIEIRIFKGTLCFESFMSYLEFVDCTIDFIKNNNTHKIVKNGVENFLNHFINNCKRYNFLSDYLIKKGFIELDENKKLIIKKSEC